MKVETELKAGSLASDAADLTSQASQLLANLVNEAEGEASRLADATIGQVSPYLGALDQWAQKEVKSLLKV